MLSSFYSLGQKQPAERPFSLQWAEIYHYNPVTAAQHFVISWYTGVYGVTTGFFRSLSLAREHFPSEFLIPSAVLFYDTL